MNPTLACDFSRSLFHFFICKINKQYCSEVINHSLKCDNRQPDYITSWLQHYYSVHALKLHIYKHNKLDPFPPPRALHPLQNEPPLANHCASSGSLCSFYRIAVVAPLARTPWKTSRWKAEFEKISISSFL